MKRLKSHLPNQQPIIYEDDDSLESVFAKDTIGMTMLNEWMDANKKYDEAKELSYTEFPSKFVYKHNPLRWQPRKIENSIGRLIQVPPSSSELFYLSLLLDIVKGPHK